MKKFIFLLFQLILISTLVCGEYYQIDASSSVPASSEGSQVTSSEDPYINSIPLSVCGTASCVPTASINSDGACKINPKTLGYYPATLSKGAFSTGKRCGECFRLIGPNGTVTVMVSDECTAGDPCNQDDSFHFGIPNEAYDKLIANRETNGNIFSLGYQEVACELDQNIFVEFAGGQTGRVDYQYYFTVRFSSYSVGIERVQCKGTGMARYMEMTLNGGGQWTWNKKNEPGEDAKFLFPASFILTGFDGEHIEYTVQSNPPASVLIDTQHQFTPVKHPEADRVCTMGMVPEIIYEDHLSFGWDATHSFQYDSLNFSADPGDLPTLNEHVIEIDCSGSCGINLYRGGGFETKYLETLKFDARADPPSSNLKIYFGVGGSYILPKTLTSDWDSYSIPVEDLKPNQIEQYLVFLNSKDGVKQKFFFDNIKWEFKAGAPKTPNVVVDTTTAFPTMRPLTSTGGVTSGGVTSGSTSGISDQVTGISDNISTDGDQITGDTNGESGSASSSTAVIVPQKFNCLLLFFISIFIYTILYL
ncbi:expansin-like protein [Tieghemostelium lacteum]|uniref:Expansin-like protein n=1 Tax=Tieghemostelium lacteum TaxID=361077 RepID=A0A152A1V4_TIELA|nr:expansin-like protein [Tieghemostelium lacteum]|eukprot:KYR00179.1 expansin-like protein [Tieghemostelium lacteum]